MLHRLCLQIAAMQNTEAARLACVEVATEILAARKREHGARGRRD